MLCDLVHTAYRNMPLARRALVAAGALSLLAIVALGGCTSGTPQKPSGPQPGSLPSPTRPTGTIPAIPGLALSSPQFAAGGAMPRATGGTAVEGGKNLSPSLLWAGPLPAGTKSFALAMVDTTPPGLGFVHWLVLDIPVSSRTIPPDASGRDTMPPGSAELRNDSGAYGYLGPQPPAGTHTYRFVLYAMPVATSGLGRGSSKQLFFAKAASALGQTVLEGTYSR
jgi:Raf kinase inhibitor-like YbhB/YbcL family protein